MKETASLTVVLLLASVCGFDAGQAQLPRQATPDPPAPFTLTPLTTHGRARQPAVSPDGNFVAYARRTPLGLEVRLLNRKTATDDVLLGANTVEYWGLDFGPDGTAVYALEATPLVGDAGGYRTRLLRIRRADRRLETVREDVRQEIALSPNGRAVAFVRSIRSTGQTALVVAPLDGGPERVLAQRPAADQISRPSWRPDGGAIVYTVIAAPGHATELAEVSVVDGRERVLAKPDGWANTPNRAAWARDGRSFLMAVNGGSELWRVSYPDGAVARLGRAGRTADVQLQDLDAASDASAIVGVRNQRSVTLWIGRPGSNGSDTEQPWFDTTPIWSTDDTLLFVRWQDQSAQLVTADVNGRVLVTAPLSVPNPQYPEISRTGTVVLYSYKVGDLSLWRTGAKGEEQLRLTSGVQDVGGHDVSADGTWIAYDKWTGGRGAIWRMSVSDRVSTPLLTDDATLPAISPDGRWVAALRRRPAPAPWDIVIVPSAGGDPVTLGNAPAIRLPLRWTPDGNFVSFTCRRNGFSNICVVPREGGPAREVTTFTDAQAGSHDWSPSGRLLVIRSQIASDLVLITLKDQR